MNLVQDLGALALFAFRVFRTFFRSKKVLPLILEQISTIAQRSLFTVASSGIFVGAILVVQFELMLSRYDAQHLLGGLNTSAILREVGPLLISFLLAGKIGAYTAAELGTMRVTEQIDAIECLGVSAMEYLIVPRFFGIVVTSVIALAIGIVLSIVGSMAIAQMLYGMNPWEYASSIGRFSGLWTIFCGLFKSTTYSFIVATVCCYQGYNATGGAQGVGRAVTRAAIFTNFYIVIANFISSHFLDLVQLAIFGES